MKDDEYFKNKYVILDTNILSQMMKEHRALKFRPIFDFLQEHNAAPFLTDAIFFEVVGFINNKEERKFVISALKKFAFPKLPITTEDVETAILLSSCYKQADPNISSKQISFCDCLNAAQLVHYGDKAFIVTADIHDYPISIFDIKKVQIIEDGRQAVVVGFITYNAKKWGDAKKAFEN